MKGKKTSDDAALLIIIRETESHNDANFVVTGSTGEP